MYKAHPSGIAADQAPLAGLTGYRLIAAMRLILASAALAIITIDPAEPDRFVTLTYTVLVLYTAYSALLYMTASGKRLWNCFWNWAHWIDADVEFLRQAAEHIKPVIDNICLVDHLASDAADEEPHRIALSIHDSIVQPYLGMQMGLAAIRRKLESGNTRVDDEIEKLTALAEIGISDLRNYISGLKDARGSDGVLVPAVRRFADKFAKATGIAVEVEAGAGLRLNDRLAAEIFQMVAEGLSNIRRHTLSTRAQVRLASHDNHFRLSIENERNNAATVALFTPRSIKERAEALGGLVRIATNAEDRTVVLVEIPI